MQLVLLQSLLKYGIFVYYFTSIAADWMVMFSAEILNVHLLVLLSATSIIEIELLL